MNTRFFRNTILPVAAILLASMPVKAAEPLSKTEIRTIVHDYIVENPQVILDAVNDYQKKSVQDRQDAALKTSQDALFKNHDDPEAGNLEGDVTVVEFFDYNCHYCKSAFTDLQTLLQKDKKLRVVFKEFPILGPTSETAARWALAAQKQKKYFEFHKALMSNKQPINDELLEKTAKDTGMDVDRAKKDIAGTAILLQIEKNRALAGQLGLNGTPAFIIGDDVVPGGIPLEEMERRVAEQRKKAGKK